MALKVAKKPTFTVNVEVFTPNDKCGHDRSTFTAKFSRTSRNELDDLRKIPQIDVLRRKLAGWADFQDEEGNELEFNDENLEVLLDIPEAVYGLTLAFWENVIKAREKN